MRYGPATLLKITLIHRVLYQDFDSDNKLDGVYIMGTLTWYRLIPKYSWNTT